MKGVIPDDPNMSQTPTFNTIEHYLGLGMEVDLIPHLYLNAYAGGGFYFYRHDSRLVQKEDSLLPEQMNGFNWNLNLGVGYRFN